MNDAPPAPCFTPPEPVTSPAVGDRVWFYFWRSFALPGQPKAGNWAETSGRVMSVGPSKVCVVLDNPSMPGHFGGDEEAPPGSPYRFVDPGRVFGSREDAVGACQGLPPPTA